MPPVSPKFEFSVVIDEFSKLTELVCYSHFFSNLSWTFSAQLKDENFTFDMSCDRLNQSVPWSVQSSYKVFLVSAGEPSALWKEGKAVFESNKKSFKLSENQETFIKDKVANDSVSFKCEIEVLSVTGFQTPMWDFSFPDGPNLSDVVIKIDEQTFHVSKMLLANCSPYFHTLFFENFKESKEQVITLKEVNPGYFQALLDVIYHKADVSILNVRDLLELVNYFDTPDVKRKCEDFLLCVADTVVSRSEKLLLSDKFLLPKLLKKCVDSLTSVSDIRSVTPKNVRELNPETIADLFQKVINFTENQNIYNVY